jgi:hypothetical protein
MVECLPGKHKAPSSNPSTAKKKKKNHEKNLDCHFQSHLGSCFFDADETLQIKGIFSIASIWLHSKF